MRDNYGFEISEGLYEDREGFKYYYIKETPNGFMKKEAADKGYSPLDSFTASNIQRISRQKELINLIFSIDKEDLLAQRQTKCTEPSKELQDFMADVKNEFAFPTSIPKYIQRD